MKFLFYLFLFGVSIFAKDFTDFRDGDIILQTSKSNQSYTIVWATKSLYSHIGVVQEINGKFFVVEAISRVSKTPIKRWIRRGRFGKFTVMRYKYLTPSRQRRLKTSLKRFMGKRYDKYFLFDKKRIYCSELVYLVYKNIGVKLGKIQKVKELDFNNYLVKRLVKKRYKKHPLCTKNGDFKSCWKKILNQKLITPKAISKDRRLKEIYSNY